MLKMEDIIGLEVLSADAKLIGAVEGIGIDVDRWRAPALTIGVKKGMETELGVKKPIFGTAKLNLDTLYVESVADVITLSRKCAQLKDTKMTAGPLPKTAGDIVLKRIVAEKGREIGYVDNIYFSPEKGWTIPLLNVRLDKGCLAELKLKKGVLKTPNVKIMTTDVRTVGDLVMLRIDLAQLHEYIEHSPQ
jgi:sporulation protein YlmC with PRC-barrel domain